MGYITLPPEDHKPLYLRPNILRIYVKPRLCSTPIGFTFQPYTAMECQLDLLMMRLGSGKLRGSPAGADIAGIVVDGKLYVDDEPYWKGLLSHGATYSVAYVRRPFSVSKAHVSLWDHVHDTPLVDAGSIPRRNPYYNSTLAIARLLAIGELTHIPAWVGRKRFYNARPCGALRRGAEEMRKAEKEERWSDVERWKVYNDREAVFPWVLWPQDRSHDVSYEFIRDWYMADGQDARAG